MKNTIPNLIKYNVQARESRNDYSGCTLIWYTYNIKLMAIRMGILQGEGKWKG